MTELAQGEMGDDIGECRKGRRDRERKAHQP
jgi:hypothetical protein